jgi:hypothetical protein
MNDALIAVTTQHAFDVPQGSDALEINAVRGHFIIVANQKPSKVGIDARQIAHSICLIVNDSLESVREREVRHGVCSDLLHKEITSDGCFDDDVSRAYGVFIIVG